MLAGVLAAAACAGTGVGCSISTEPDAPPEGSEAHEKVTGLRNRLGLRLTYDEQAQRVDASTNRPLEDDERLFVRVRRGTLSEQTQHDLACTDLASQPDTAAGKGVWRAGTVRFEGPKVATELLALRTMFDSEVWLTGPITDTMRDELQKGTDAIVEGCVLKGERVQAKVQTTLWYAMDLGRRELGGASLDRHVAAVDAGAGGPRAAREVREVRELREGVRIDSMEEYAALCVAELGEIPFFRKKSDGRYDTYDCRDFKNGEDGSALPEVEGALIPLTAFDVPKTKCDRNKGHYDYDTSANYDCVTKCDKPQNLFSACEPGPTVSTAKNDKGTHWVLLCRAADVAANVGNTTDGAMLKTKTFRDMAMIGHNPKTGKTCFFQNKLGLTKDGAHVSHPADLEKSKNVWDTPKGYCMGSCHSADAYIHSPWIDGALRKNGNTIVPKMGEHPDFPISWLDAPYSVVNMDAQGSGWSIGQQLVSEEASACTTCHRVAGTTMMSKFSAWGTATSVDTDPFFAKVTDSYKNSFKKSHWMPTNVDMWDAASWQTSKWKKATDHIVACGNAPRSAGCIFDDVPRGSR
ncbi:hypothetical protein [Pendulispora albinea]|uniref:Lipoprotein n=1 Tax=Pendulispora albinea TaxID=2741071 RepID=A0ABZ2M7T2_9BACT